MSHANRNRMPVPPAVPQSAPAQPPLWRRTRKTLACLAVLSTLTACASGPQPIVATYPAPPATLTQPCPLSTPEPASGAPADLLANHTGWALALHRCRARHADLIDWLDAIRNPQ